MFTFPLFAADYWLTLWSTPMWLLGLGVLSGLVLVALFFGLATLASRVPGLNALPIFSRRAVGEFWETLREGPLWPISWVAIFLVVVALLATGVRKTGDYWESITRLGVSGTIEHKFEVPPGATLTQTGSPLEQFYSAAMSFRRAEVASLEIHSNEVLHVRGSLTAEERQKNQLVAPQVEVASNVLRIWRPTSADRYRMFGSDDVKELLIKNLGSKPALVTVTLTTQPPIPEVRTIPAVAIGVFGVFLIYFLQRTMFPRVSAIALATYKSEVAQPLFLIFAALGAFLLLVFIVVPYHTFGEDIKMLKDSGLTLIMVAAIFLSIWGASTSIADEIEGRTALTVLSKPLYRHSFIVGKFLGIGWMAAVLFAILGSLYLMTVCYKPVYDQAEGVFQDEVIWQICHMEMSSVLPGLLLAFMETLTLTAISVAISTRLPMLANFVITGTFYVLGNLTGLIGQSSAGQSPIVRFMGQLIGVIVPNLENYNAQAAFAASKTIPMSYVGTASVYCFICTLIALFVALLMFEDRDLA